MGADLVEMLRDVIFYLGLMSPACFEDLVLGRSSFAPPSGEYKAELRKLLAVVSALYRLHCLAIHHPDGFSFEGLSAAYLDAFKLYSNLWFLFGP